MNKQRSSARYFARSKRGILNILLRQPLAFLGAIGIISMLKGTITIHADILVLVKAYQTVTQPIWDFLLGWLFDWVKLPFPSWAKDYLTMGLISATAFVRAKAAVPYPRKVLFVRKGTQRRYIIRVLESVFLWPILLLAKTLTIVLNRRRMEQEIEKQRGMWLAMRSESRIREDYAYQKKLRLWALNLCSGLLSWRRSAMGFFWPKSNELF